MPQPTYSRRNLLDHVGKTLLGTALASLLPELSGYANDAARPEGLPHGDLMPRSTHHPARAKAVIHLFMNGGPSQMDLFDPKPELDKHHGEDYFNRIAGEVEGPQAAGALLRSSFKFARHGESGMWVSDAMPHFAKVVDQVSMIRSLYTTNLTHEPALWKIHSGQTIAGLPSIGSWVTYALGSENQSLPAYVVLDDPGGLPINGVQNWQSGYLPPQFQGTRFRSKGSPILNLTPQYDDPPAVLSVEREVLAKLDAEHLRHRPRQTQLGARIASYELAGRMQMAAAEALDISRETAQTLEMYGIGREPTDSYGRRCLYARRLVERGVRFVQLYIAGQTWDNHSQIATSLKSACDATDQGVTALILDLKQRGLLDETLLIWGGEMGRLPIAQLTPDKDEAKAGRDHNKNAICMWMAGGGIKSGFVFGETDDIGLAAVQDRVSVADLHATIYHLLGLDYERTYYLRNGLKERLTGVESARVIQEVIA